MKIAVIGTSNSILTEGYFPLYQAMEYPNSVDNLSIGGANCQLIPYSIEKYKIFDNYDFLITDCAVNDGDYVIPKFRSPDWLYNELYSIMSLIKESPIRQLHLIFPTNTACREHYKIHCQVCQELAVPYIDIEKILAASKKSGQKDLFLNDKHISLFLAKQLAYVIKNEREKIFSKPKSNDLSACYKHKKYIFYSLPEKFEDTFPHCKKSSSLITDAYIILKNTDTLHLDNLPQLNLESIAFWTNTNAHYYTLTSETQKKSYNIFYPDAHYTNFRPIPKQPFPVSRFLKLQPGLDATCFPPLREFALKSPPAGDNELMLNSFLFSQTINPPLKWKEKELFDNSGEYLPTFCKIYSSCTAVPKLVNNSSLKYIPAEYLFIAAHMYPKNKIVRKEFTKLLRKTDNPYFLHAYVKLYLLPRKKYTPAIKMLKHVLAQNRLNQAVVDLAHCYIQLEQYVDALKSVKLISEEKYPAKRLQLLCSIYAHMNLPDLFFQHAENMLKLNENYSSLFQIIDNCILLKKYDEALSYIQKIFDEPRNFVYEEYEKEITDKINKIKSCIANENI